jgi:hypothetical protein
MPFRQPQNYVAKLIHRYDLTQDFTDFFGGGSLEPLGGIRSSTGYSFTEQQGLKLVNLVPPNNFSLLIDFKYTYTSSYNKLVDTTNLTSDLGIYLTNQSLSLYSPTITVNSPLLIAPGTPGRLVVVSDLEQPYIRAYFNGNLIAAAVIADILDNTSGFVHLFQDDAVAGSTETIVGECTQIAIFDGALSNQQVLSLGTVGHIF